MTDDRIAALERRVQALEDQLAICQLIATYGPAVDSESAEAVGELWAVDGVYDPGGVSPYVGRAAVGGLVHGERHQAYLEAGCAHVLSAPQVSIGGDVAVAVNHSRVYLKDARTGGWSGSVPTGGNWSASTGRGGSSGGRTACSTGRRRRGDC